METSQGDEHVHLRRTVSDWLAQRQGVSRNDAELLPDSVIQEIVRDPRTGIQELLEHLGRRTPPEGKLRYMANDISQRLREAATIEASSFAPDEGDRSAREVVSDEEKKLDALLLDIDRSFLEFERSVLAAAEECSLPPYLCLSELLGPFNTIRRNQHNSQRNMIRRRRQGRSGTIPSDVGLYHPSYFFCDFMSKEVFDDMGNNPVAGFAPLRRILLLPSNFDCSSIPQQLVLYHELCHANHDAIRRHQLRQSQSALSEYEAFLSHHKGERMRILVTDEGGAFALELEVLNILLRGKLRSGLKPSLAEVSEALGATEKEQKIADLLVNLAPYYFPEGLEEGGKLSVRFLDTIDRQYTAGGYEVHIGLVGGGTRRYKQGGV